MNDQLACLYEKITSKNPSELEFHQAVKEVFESLCLIVDKHPEFMEEKIVERICEPERVIMFRVSWHDDDGVVQVSDILPTLKV